MACLRKINISIKEKFEQNLYKKIMRKKIDMYIEVRSKNNLCQKLIRKSIKCVHKGIV